MTSLNRFRLSVFALIIVFVVIGIAPASAHYHGRSYYNNGRYYGRPYHGRHYYPHARYYGNRGYYSTKRTVVIYR